MRRNVFLISVFLISFAGYSQTYNKNAKEFSIKGNDKISRKEYSGAIEDFSNAIKYDPGFKQAYENRGVARFYLQDFSGAIEDYTIALELDPNEYTTYGRRGWAKFYLNDYKGAVDDLDKAVQGSSDKYRYYNFRGEAKFRLKDFEGAIADFNIVIGSRAVGKEQKSKALFWRGMINISLGQKDIGCPDLKKAAKSGYPMAGEAVKINCNQ